MAGLESAFAYGPYKLQGEFVKATFDAVSGLANAGSAVTGTADVTAGYAEVMYNVTGEKWSDSYRSGAFSGIKPNSNFTSNGGTGAWQVGLRFSRFSVADVELLGTANNRAQNSPNANTTTLGINWLLNPNARVMFNYARTKFNAGVTPLDVTGAAIGSEENVISMRTQINF
jgi:phosphate-selective porin OprO/OprP